MKEILMCVSVALPKRTLLSLIVLVTGCAGTGTPARGAAEQPLVLAQEIPVPQITGGTNHLAIDAKHGRVFVTAPGDKLVVVADLESGKVVRALKTPGAAAAAFAPDLNQLCVSGGGAVTVYDGDSFAELGRVELSHSLDELCYDPAEHRLYAGVMDADAAGIAIIDLPNRKLLGQVKLPAKPQGFVIEQDGSRIFANTPMAGQVTVVDRKAQKVVASWRLADAKGNYPIALDEAHKRLFVGCRKPSKLLVLDTDTGKVVASAPTAEDADDMSFDPQTRRAYLACGDGVVSVVEEEDPDHYRALPNVRTIEGARNSMFFPERKVLVVAVPKRGSREANIQVFSAQPRQ